MQSNVDGWRAGMTGVPHTAPAYSLTVQQQPERARLCSYKEENETIDRRPVDPPPVVELRCNDIPAEQFLESTSFFIRATTVSDQPSEPTDEHLQSHYPPSEPFYEPVKTPLGADATTGEVIQTPEKLRTLDGKVAALCIFAKLSVRVPGTFRLRFTLYETSPQGLFELAHVVSEPFEVFSPKLFKGMHESTALTRHLAAQGLKVKLRTDTHVGRQSGNRRRQADSSSNSAGPSSTHSQSQSDKHRPLSAPSGPFSQLTTSTPTPNPTPTPSSHAPPPPRSRSPLHPAGLVAPQPQPVQRRIVSDSPRDLVWRHAADKSGSPFSNGGSASAGSGSASVSASGSGSGSGGSAVGGSSAGGKRRFGDDGPIQPFREGGARYADDGLPLPLRSLQLRYDYNSPPPAAATDLSAFSLSRLGSSGDPSTSSRSSPAISDPSRLSSASSMSSAPSLPPSQLSQHSQHSQHSHSHTQHSSQKYSSSPLSSSPLTTRTPSAFSTPPSSLSSGHHSPFPRLALGSGDDGIPILPPPNGYAGHGAGQQVGVGLGFVPASVGQVLGGEIRGQQAGGSLGEVHQHPHTHPHQHVHPHQSYDHPPRSYDHPYDHPQQHPHSHPHPPQHQHHQHHQRPHTPYSPNTAHHPDPSYSHPHAHVPRPISAGAAPLGTGGGVGAGAAPGAAADGYRMSPLTLPPIRAPSDMGRRGL
ncbi:hypothetical protein IAT38_001470 [Cryptococcus sp. DSM 104549]